MAEKFELQLNAESLNSLQNGTDNASQFLSNVFAQKQSHAALCNALKEYHRNDGGSPEVHNFETENAAVDLHTLTGRFRCRFKVEYHFTCSDVHNSSSDTIDWAFSIDATNAKIYFTGEEVLTRDFE